MDKKLMALLVAMVLCVPAMGWCEAQEEPYIDLDGQNSMFNFEQVHYERSPANKLGRGLINTATCWAEIPGQVAEVSNRENPLLGVTLGGAQGTVNAFIRGTTGVIEAVTFLFPPYDKPLVHPEYAAVSADERMKEYLW